MKIPFHRGAASPALTPPKLGEEISLRGEGVVKHTRSRQRAYLSGRRAERIACWLLRLKGYRILAVNWRCPAGEVDILARRGRVLAAVEVKRRSGGLVAGEAAGDAALFAISPRQQARVARAAAVFVSRRSDCQNLTLR